MISIPGMIGVRLKPRTIYVPTLTIIMPSSDPAVTIPAGSFTLRCSVDGDGGEWDYCEYTASGATNSTGYLNDHVWYDGTFTRPLNNLAGITTWVVTGYLTTGESATDTIVITAT